jgi:hypothetical protein
VSFSGSDGLSGIDNCSAPEALGSNGAGQSASGTCQDTAGNTSTAAVVSDINIDAQVPSIVITTPADGASYLVNASVLAEFFCSDALSGIANCMGSTANGAAVATSVPGSFTFAVNATDKADMTASKSNAYSVRYGFVGFLQPVDNLPVMNSGNAGRTIPVKWQVVDANGGYLSSLSTFRSLVSGPAACQSGALLDDIEEVAATGGTVLRYDATSNQFIYNWATASSWKGKCRKLVLELADGQKKEALFRFK